MSKIYTNHGKRWNDSDRVKVRECMASTGNIKELAENIQRTPGSITSEWHKMVVLESEESGKKLEELAQTYNIEKECLQKKKSSLSPRKKPTPVPQHSPEPPIAEQALTLNEEQENAYNKVIETQESIFLTGCPGTGKTFTLKHIINGLRLKRKVVGVTATTGCAALLIGAQTVHSYLKLGLINKTARELARNLYKFESVKERILGLEFLVIEEISMLSDSDFDTISEYLSIVRKNAAPFGGIKMIFVGDFCQLAPVEAEYCFESREWKRLNPTTINLSTLVRQSEDSIFQGILQRSRFGNVTTEDIELLEKCERKEGKNYTRLRSTNEEANRINMRELKTLMKDNPRSFTYDVGLPLKLQLCVGCRVMVTWNVCADEGIINGTSGTVVELTKDSVKIKLSGSERTYVITQIEVKDDITYERLKVFMPLQLSWATTIHKSQGATIDYLEVDLGFRVFANGQAYVALSRVRNLESLCISDVEKRAFKTSEKVKSFYGVC
jgi:ATP-dependent exoDNAse (exonuclease V) alpha subunit